MQCTLDLQLLQELVNFNNVRSSDIRLFTGLGYKDWSATHWRGGLDYILCPNS